MFSGSNYQWTCLNLYYAGGLFVYNNYQGACHYLQCLTFFEKIIPCVQDHVIMFGVLILFIV
jgi:hypothetical protein